MPIGYSGYNTRRTETIKLQNLSKVLNIERDVELCSFSDGILATANYDGEQISVWTIENGQELRLKLHIGNFSLIESNLL